MRIYLLQLPIYSGGYAAPGYGAPPPPTPPPALVCRDLHETVCNTSVLTGPQADTHHLSVETQTRTDFFTFLKQNSNGFVSVVPGVSGLSGVVVSVVSGV